MRVVAGEARGRRLRAKLPSHVRPTTDLVREAVFSVLATRLDLHDARVCDLYCGSGAMGIEALSRGAASCTFVDDDDACLAAACRNLELVQLDARTVRFVRARLPFGRPDGPFDLVCCDPPYGELDLAALLDGLDASVVVVETDQPLDAPSGWETTFTRLYGGTLVTVFEPADQQGRS